MDIFGEKYIPAMRKKDFKAAQEFLEQWKHSVSVGMYMWAKAGFYRDIGQKEKSYEILSHVIDEKMDDGKICQESRAYNYLNDKQYLKSLIDYNIVISDKGTQVFEMYHDGSLFRKAYILAVLGETEFTDVIEQIPEDEEIFVIDAMYDKASLICIYNANKKPVRPKPDLG